MSVKKYATHFYFDACQETEFLENLYLTFSNNISDIEFDCKCCVCMQIISVLIRDGDLESKKCQSVSLVKHYIYNTFPKHAWGYKFD